MRTVVAALIGAAAVLAGCVGSNLASLTTSPSPNRPTSAATAAPPSPAPTNEPSPSGAACLLDGKVQEWMAIPESGRCSVTVFDPLMSFEAGPGWLWAGRSDRWALTRDNGAFTLLSAYRYGGFVVPAYCQDPPPTVAMTTGSEVVAWLETVADLDVEVLEVSAVPHPAWRVDLRSHVPSCSGDPGKDGLAALWTIDGQPIELPETLTKGEQMRAYLVELPSEIVILTATSHPIEGMPGIPDNSDFLLRVEEVFSSLQFD